MHMLLLAWHVHYAFAMDECCICVAMFGQHVEINLCFFYLLGKPGIPMLRNISKTISTTSIELTWSAAPENGAKILVYTIWWREIQSNGAVGRWSRKNITSIDRTYTVTGLENGRTYQFGVTAWNKHGESAWDKKKGLKQVEIVGMYNTVPHLFCIL